MRNIPSKETFLEKPPPHPASKLKSGIVSFCACYVSASQLDVMEKLSSIASFTVLSPMGGGLFFCSADEFSWANFELFSCLFTFERAALTARKIFE